MIGKPAAMRKRPSLGAGYAWVILTVVWLALEREGFLGIWRPETGGAVAIHDARGGRHAYFTRRSPH
jgi:hypothetical protein